MLESLARTLERVTKKEGEVASLLVYPLLSVVVYEVFMRYVFNAPTTWGFEATTFIYGLHYMFGLAYTDAYDGHVKVDIFTSLAPAKLQAVLRILTNLLLFMPVTLCMAVWSVKFAYVSVSGMEVNSTSWAPPIWPLKILMALCLIFLLMQGVANLIKDINALKRSC